MVKAGRIAKTNGGPKLVRKWALGWPRLGGNQGVRTGPDCVGRNNHTSQSCSECGNVHPDNRKSQAVFHCRACGHLENADTNAAKKKKRGRREYRLVGYPSECGWHKM
jgi:ribosomal protein L37AE/L43A